MSTVLTSFLPCPNPLQILPCLKDQLSPKFVMASSLLLLQTYI